MKTLDCQVAVPTKTGDVTLTLVVVDSDGFVVAMDIHPFARERLFDPVLDQEYFSSALSHLGAELNRAREQAANQAALQPPPQDAGAA